MEEITNKIASKRTPPWLFALQLIYLASLACVGVIYLHWSALRELIPDPIGPVPLAVPWWGALGGITISFTGIFRNSITWDNRYDLWHIARPFIGAIVGSVAFLIFIALIRATGVTAARPNITNSAIFDLVAYVAGYREEVFRELLRRASDSLFANSPRNANDYMRGRD